MAAPRSLRVLCPAKINLGLWILGRRADGYHDIDTVFQAVDLEDEVVIEEAPSGFSLQVEGIPILDQGPNLIERAWSLIEPRVSGRGVRVRLVKRIPIGAGLGGGSSDAAGFLVGVTRMFHLALAEEEMRAMCVRLGADLTFFLKGGTARGTGRGDEVRHLCPLPSAWIVLATPPFAISTSWAYAKVRISLTPPEGGASMLAVAIERGDWNEIAPLLHNDFEEVVVSEFALLSQLKRSLVDGGSLGSLLSGSGSTVFGLALTRNVAERAAEKAEEWGATVRVVRTTERGVAVQGPE